MRPRCLYLSLVAAGGFARRCNLTVPKSLLQVKGKTLVRVTVDELVKAGAHPVLVANNRREFSSELARSLRGIRSWELVEDPGYPSTLPLVQDQVHRMQERFVFAYGHSPRQSHLVKALMQTDYPLACAAYSGSSSAKPIPWRGLYLEPPFILSKELVRKTVCKDWLEFFEYNEDSVLPCQITGPSEFNIESERDDYLHYVNGF